jgi:hypothetical protein
MNMGQGTGQTLLAKAFTGQFWGVNEQEDRK